MGLAMREKDKEAKAIEFYQLISSLIICPQPLLYLTQVLCVPNCLVVI